MDFESFVNTLASVNDGSLDMCENTNKVDNRSQMFSIALQQNEGLQKALDSSKHGKTAKSYGNFPLSLDNILLGSHKSAKVKTVCIHYNATHLQVQYMWYSLTCVRIRDVYKDFYYQDQKYTIVLLRDLMSLYCLTVEEAIQGIIANNEDIKVGGHCYDDDVLQIICTSLTGDIMRYFVRGCDHDICPVSWSVGDPSEEGTVYTIIEGNVYDKVIEYCDELICSDLNSMVKATGVINTYSLCSSIFRLDNSSILLATLLSFTDRNVNDHSNIAQDDIIKSFSMGKQLESIRRATTQGLTDNLTSMESTLMVGGKLDPIWKKS